ncbi:MAG: serine acetyltransferase [Oscillospiraceae bacterium]|nr:serine acetyltransferase [Oscillospiraceae bacterium]
MYPDYIRTAARAMADNMARSEVPLYGSGLRLPDRKAVIALIKEIRRLMFPAYYGDKALMTLAPHDYAALLLDRIQTQLTDQIALALPEEDEWRASAISRELIECLPRIQAMLLKDLDATFDGDPAAQDKNEIIFAYPGLFAIFVYRIAHELYLRKVPMIPRMMTEYAHSRTGIDINPGATIGEYFFIDHGTGIVVGETSVIGSRVKLYQGVTLGALSPRAGHSSLPGKRHPTVEDNVTIYSGASILGGETVIGTNSVVGGNAFLTEAVEANTRVVIQAPETIFKDTNQ